MINEFIHPNEFIGIKCRVSTFVAIITYSIDRAKCYLAIGIAADGIILATFITRFRRNARQKEESTGGGEGRKTRKNNYDLLSFPAEPRLQNAWPASVIGRFHGRDASHRKNSRRGTVENRSRTKIEKGRHVRNTRAAE